MLKIYFVKINIKIINLVNNYSGLIVDCGSGSESYKAYIRLGNPDGEVAVPQRLICKDDKICSQGDGGFGGPTIGDIFFSNLQCPLRDVEGLERIFGNSKAILVS